MPVGPSAAAYFWIDQADGLADVIGNSPPDYAFRHEGVENWAWVSRMGETLIVEPGRDGVVQYYFAPRATAPYLVRDSYYSYGFDGPELMQLYDNAGRIPRAWPTSRQRYDGEELQRRGRALLSASWRQRQWDSAAAQSWQRQQGYAFDVFGGSGSGWNSGWRDEWRSQPDWRAFETTERNRRPARRLDDERRERRDAGYRFDQWHRGGARGAPPLPANPIVLPTATPALAPVISPAPVPPPVPRAAPLVPAAPIQPVVVPVFAPMAPVTPSPTPAPAWREPEPQPVRPFGRPAAPEPQTQLVVPPPAPAAAPVVAIPQPMPEPIPVPDPAIAAEAARQRADAEQAAIRARAEAEAAQAQAQAEAAQAQAAQAQAEAAALEARRSAAAAEARAQAEAAAARAQAEAAAAARPADSVDAPARPLGENEREQ